MWEGDSAGLMQVSGAQQGGARQTDEWWGLWTRILTPAWQAGAVLSDSLDFLTDINAAYDFSNPRVRPIAL